MAEKKWPPLNNLELLVPTESNCHTLVSKIQLGTTDLVWDILSDADHMVVKRSLLRLYLAMRGVLREAKTDLFRHVAAPTILLIGKKVAVSISDTKVTAGGKTVDWDKETLSAANAAARALTT